jgi:hypothetical protein
MSRIGGEILAWPPTPLRAMVLVSFFRPIAKDFSIPALANDTIPS